MAGCHADSERTGESDLLEEHSAASVIMGQERLDMAVQAAARHGGPASGPTRGEEPLQGLGAVREGISQATRSQVTSGCQRMAARIPAQGTDETPGTSAILVRSCSEGGTVPCRKDDPFDQGPEHPDCILQPGPAPAALRAGAWAAPSSNSCRRSGHRPRPDRSARSHASQAKRVSAQAATPAAGSAMRIVPPAASGGRWAAADGVESC